MRADSIVELMKRSNIPMTREKYLYIAYMGTPPEVLDAEAEYALPEQFQLNPSINYDE